MSGAPGSGKSTIARLLRPCVNGIIIDHDVLRSSLLTSTSTYQFDHAAKQAYDIQWALACDFLKQGVEAIIIDSICNYAEVLEQGQSLAAQYGYRYWYIECKADDIELLDQRLRARFPMPSQRSAVDCPPASAQVNGARVGEDARARFDRWMKSPCRPHDDDIVIVVDSTTDLKMLKDNILARMAYKL